MRSRSGFTLIEAAIVMAVIALLAVVSAAMMRSARGNAGTASAAFDLVLRLQGLKTRALTDQKDFVLVLVNPPGDDATGCGALSSKKCLRWYLLSSPTAAWTLNAFDTSSAGTNAAMEDSGRFDRGVRLDFDTTGTAGPAPFSGVKQLDAEIQGSCKNEDAATCHCLAVRFSATGDVNPVVVTPATPSGMLFGLVGATAAERTGGTTRRAILVSAPTGIVKSYLY